MKVTHRSAEMLIVEDQPWVSGLVLITLVTSFAAAAIFAISDSLNGSLLLFGFAAFCILMFAIFIRRVQAVFHRPGGWVEIRRQTLRGRTALRHDLTQVERALVEALSSDDGMTYRVALVVRLGDREERDPLTPVYSSGDGAQRAADAINDWLAAGAP